MEKRRDYIVESASLLVCMLAILYGVIALQLPICVPKNSNWYPANMIVCGLVAAIICYEINTFLSILIKEIRRAYCYKQNIPFDEKTYSMKAIISGAVINCIFLTISIVVPMVVCSELNPITIIVPVCIFFENALQWATK